MICPNCKNLKTEFSFEAQNTHGSRKLSEEKFVILRCAQCRVIFPRLTINKGFFKKYYPRDYYHSSHFSPNFFLRKYEQLCLAQAKSLVNRFLKKGKILDFGCGLGQFLAFLPDDDFEKYGIEVNSKAFRFIKKNFPQIKVFNDLSSLKPRSKFNLITLWHVLEHLEDPKETLRQLAGLMKKDGFLLISTPNSQSLGFRIGQANWFHLDSPRHLVIFNLESLAALCEEVGLKIILVQGNRLEYPLDLFWSVYNRYKTKYFGLNFLMGFFILPVTLVVKLVCSLTADGKKIHWPALEKFEVITLVCKKK